MRSFYYVLFIILICTITAGAQKIIRGKIINSLTKEPLTYASIGIAAAGAGTISNSDGSFSIPIPARLLADSLTFSSLGYSSKRIAVKFFNSEKSITIALNEKAILLRPAILSAKKEKDKFVELGNAAFNGGAYEPDTLYSGRTIALLIKNTDKNIEKGFQFPVYLEKARLRIFRNNLSSFKFRLRINAVEAGTGLPGKDLLQENIIVTSAMRNGWLNFDLSTLNFLADSSFFICFEQILDSNDRTAIADGFRDFIRKHPKHVKTDTVLFEGEKWHGKN